MTNEQLAKLIAVGGIDKLLPILCNIMRGFYCKLTDKYARQHLLILVRYIKQPVAEQAGQRATP